MPIQRLCHSGNFPAAPYLGCRVQPPAPGTRLPWGVQSAGTACSKCKISATEANCEAACPIRPLDHHLVEKIIPLTVLRHSNEVLWSCMDDCRPVMPFFLVPKKQMKVGNRFFPAKLPAEGWPVFRVFNWHVTNSQMPDGWKEHWRSPLMHV